MAVLLNPELFSCSNCLETMKDPVTIPCGHSYCFSCIKDHWDGEDDKGIHSCPQCRKLFTPRPELLRSIVLAALVDEVKKTGLDLKRKTCCCRGRCKDHNTDSAAAEKREQQEELQESRPTIQQRIQDREEDVKVLQQEVKDINLFADGAVEYTQSMFSQLIDMMEEKISVLKQHIRSQQEAEVRRVKELQEKLEQEITELKSKDAELQQLSHSEDHCHFLHNYPSVSQLSGSTHSSSVNIHPRRYFEDVTMAVSDSYIKLRDLLCNSCTHILLTPVDVLLSANPKTRAEFLKYSCDLTLDPNTASTEILLSEGNRIAAYTENGQSYPDHPDRFIDWPQVLSRESLTGRCYWEVKVSEGGGAEVGVAYKSISREGGDSLIGLNDESWNLHCSSQSTLFFYDTDSISSRAVFWPSTVGVYLDHLAGVLSFYNVSDTMTLLHRIQTSFTQPLHAGLMVSSKGASAELVKLK